jgi:chromosome segregation ATPase
LLKRLHDDRAAMGGTIGKLEQRLVEAVRSSDETEQQNRLLADRAQSLEQEVAAVRAQLAGCDTRAEELRGRQAEMLALLSRAEGA